MPNDGPKEAIPHADPIDPIEQLDADNAARLAQEGGDYTEPLSVDQLNAQYDQTETQPIQPATAESEHHAPIIQDAPAAKPAPVSAVSTDRVTNGPLKDLGDQLVASIELAAGIDKNPQLVNQAPKSWRNLFGLIKRK